MGFIEPALLEGDQAEGLTCSICMLLLEAPRSVCGEGHLLCLDCARQALSRTPKCPECRADASVAALHRNRRVEAELDGLRMRCTHGRAAAPEPDTKRQRTDLEPSYCDWRGKVAEYRAHLKECPFEPYKCEDCGEMVARREKEAHAAVCKITCPFFGCSHKCTHAEMAQHHVDCADAHARAAAAALKAAKEETPFKFCLCVPADRAFPPSGGVSDTINSQEYTIWPGLYAFVSWAGFPPGAFYAAPAEDQDKLYCVFVNIMPKVHAPGQLRYRGTVALLDSNGKDVVQRGFCGKADGDREIPADQGLSLKYQFALTDEQKARATHTDGTIRIIGSYYFSNTWMTEQLDEAWETFG